MFCHEWERKIWHLIFTWLKLIIVGMYLLFKNLEMSLPFPRKVTYIFCGQIGIYLVYVFLNKSISLEMSPPCSEQLHFKIDILKKGKTFLNSCRSDACIIALLLYYVLWDSRNCLFSFFEVPKWVARCLAFLIW